VQLKFLTLNLFEGGVFWNNALDFLISQQPDIFCLQEAYNSYDENLAPNLRSVEILAKHFNNYYFRFAPLLRHIRQEGKIEFGNLIFSRFPIISHREVFFDIPYDPEYVREEKKGDYRRIPRNLQLAEIKANDKIINVGNVHGIWDFHGRDNPRRLQMSKIIVKEIKDRQNVILAGDFNISPDTKTIKNIEKELNSVFKESLISTFNMSHKTNPGYAAAAVDMIFVSKNIKIFNKSCLQVDVSDHFPLICRLDF
jgi:endonuclease/exonuclease/phosphatase family metal-dependent hydrolase